MNKSNKTPYQLGVDIGTGSVAWVAVSTGVDVQAPCIIGQGLRIFGEPVEDIKGNYVLKSEQRRRARLTRRQIERKRARIAKLLHLGAALGVSLKDLAAVHQRGRATQRLWELRVKALDQAISMPELMAVLLRMAKNRGYFGVAPAANKKGDLGVVGAALAQTQGLRQRHPQARTATEAVWLEQAGKKLAQRRHRKSVLGGHYVLRSDIEAEFDLILTEQRKHHPSLDASLAAVLGQDLVAKLVRDAQLYRSADGHGKGSGHFWGHVPATMGEALRLTLFYQRPLQGFKDLIGSCSLIPTERRVVCAHPAFQAFRVEKLLADLKWGDGEALTLQQRAVIRPLLASQQTLGFGSLYKALLRADCMHPDGLTVNMHTPRRDTLKGSSTRAKMGTLGLMSQWDQLSSTDQGQVITALSDDINAPEAWGLDGARALALEVYGLTVVDFIDHMAQANGGLERLRAMDFDAGRCAYGPTALKHLTEYMRLTGLGEQDAVQALYPEARNRTMASGQLPTVESLGLRSPVVEHALQHTRRELLEAVRRYGPPERLTLELARPLKASLDERAQIEKRQAAEEKVNKNARDEIAKAGLPITRTAVLRYKLWMEQAKRCPYSGQAILSIEDATAGDRFELEHIIPRRLHGVGNRQSDMVLVAKQYNGLKGADETPYKAAHHTRNSGRWDWELTEQAVKAIRKESPAFRRKAETILDTTDYSLREVTDEDFVDRQLQETQWIGRVVLAWCRHLCDDVTVVRGGLTAELRRSWGLDSLLEQLRVEEGKHDKPKAQDLFYKPHAFKDERVFDKRVDHRQHLIDAAVIALSTRQHYVALVRARNAQSRHARQQAAPVCPITGLREHLHRLLKGFVVWHVPDRLVTGNFFKQEPLGSRDGVALHKNGKVAAVKFNPSLDRRLERTDRHGRRHVKYLLKEEAACIAVYEDRWELLNKADYLARIAGRKPADGLPPGLVRLVFKGDLVAIAGQAHVFCVQQLKGGDGIACLPTTEGMPFDSLKGTGLTKFVGKLTDLKTLKVFNHPAEVARYRAQLKGA